MARRLPHALLIALIAAVVMYVLISGGDAVDDLRNNLPAELLGVAGGGILTYWILEWHRHRSFEFRWAPVAHQTLAWVRGHLHALLSSYDYLFWQRNDRNLYLASVCPVHLDHTPWPNLVDIVKMAGDNLDNQSDDLHPQFYTASDLSFLLNHTTRCMENIATYVGHLTPLLEDEPLFTHALAKVRLEVGIWKHQHKHVDDSAAIPSEREAKAAIDTLEALVQLRRHPLFDRHAKHLEIP